MGKTKDWVPRGHTELFTLVVTILVPYFDLNRIRFGMIAGTPAGDWYDATFTVKTYNPYVTAYNLWISPSTRTPLVVDDLAETEKAMIDRLRQLNKMLIGDPAVTDTDLDAMGFPKRPTNSRTPAPVATDAPRFSFTPLVGHRLQIDYLDKESPRPAGAKPKGQHGAEIRWAFSETPIVNYKDLVNSVFDTASPAIIEFEGDNCGRTIYVAMRWENTRGEKGPWSDIESTHVP
ncbi:MAG: hypothetical protein LBB84_12390 [Tannerellaceae bacterium]|nr:hypothetical protein [Tannerellaceae bacterium]